MRLIVFMLIPVIMGAGCGKKRTYVTPGGTVHVEQKRGDDQTVQIDTGKGTATFETGKKSITEAELGAPVYPGAVVESSGSFEDSGSGQNTTQHVLTTSDGFDKVLAFYKSNLKNIKSSVTNTTADESMAMLGAKTAAGDEINVHITTDKEKKLTRILVMKVGKAK